MSLEDKVIITCALTGVLATREQCPGIPYTPVEIAEEAKRVWNAGATCVHIDGKNDDGSPSWDLQTFRKIKDEVRKRCPIILNFSTGTMDDDISMQAAIIRELKPEIAALNMGTMNYAKFSPNRGEFVFDMVFPNTFGKILQFLDVINENGVKPELECFDAGRTRIPQSLWPSAQHSAEAAEVARRLVGPRQHECHARKAGGARQGLVGRLLVSRRILTWSDHTPRQPRSRQIGIVGAAALEDHLLQAAGTPAREQLLLDQP